MVKQKPACDDPSRTVEVIVRFSSGGVVYSETTHAYKELSYGEAVVVQDAVYTGIKDALIGLGKAEAERRGESVE